MHASGLWEEAKNIWEKHANSIEKSMAASDYTPILNKYLLVYQTRKAAYMLVFTCVEKSKAALT